jgi:uncharacterized protein YaeQ
MPTPSESRPKSRVAFARAARNLKSLTQKDFVLALTATVYTFDIELADTDRGVYETLALRVARHPSETEAYLATRVLADCLEYAEGIAFSSGLADPDEPALAVRDLTGALRVWIEIGAPEAARVHRASKAAPRVVVYTHKDAAKLAARWAGERIHRANELELYAFDPALLEAFVARLARRMVFALAVTNAHLYITFGDAVIEGALEPYAWQETAGSA